MGLHVFLIHFNTYSYVPSCPDTVRYSSVTVLLSFLFISFYLQPPGIFTNGLLDLEPPAKVNPLPPTEGGPALTHALPHLVHTRNTMSTR